MSVLGPGFCVPGFPDFKFILKAGKKRRERSRRGGEEREKKEERKVISLSTPENTRLLLTLPLLDRIMALRYSELCLSKLQICHLSRQRGLKA